MGIQPKFTAEDFDNAKVDENICATVLALSYSLVTEFQIPSVEGKYLEDENTKHLTISPVQRA